MRRRRRRRRTEQVEAGLSWPSGGNDGCKEGEDAGIKEKSKQRVKSKQEDKKEKD